MIETLERTVADLETQFERYDLSEIAEIVGVRISEDSMIQSVSLKRDRDVIEIVLNDALPANEKRRWFFGVLASLKIVTGYH